MDFIVSCIARELDRVESDFYITCSEHDGDNSDNGHHIISLDLVEEELQR